MRKYGILLRGETKAPRGEPHDTCSQSHDEAAAESGIEPRSPKTWRPSTPFADPHLPWKGGSGLKPSLNEQANLLLVLPGLREKGTGVSPPAAPPAAATPDGRDCGKSLEAMNKSPLPRNLVPRPPLFPVLRSEAARSTRRGDCTRRGHVETGSLQSSPAGQCSQSSSRIMSKASQPERHNGAISTGPRRE